MSYNKSKCGNSYNEENNRYREQKREEKQRRRQEKKEEKQRYREEKRERKQRYREEKRRHREEFVAHIFNLSTSRTTTNVVGQPVGSNINYNKIEHDVATLRTIFPDCDPVFIRNCLLNETGEDRIRKVAEKLLTTNYPKEVPVSPLTPPTAPPLLIRNSLESPFDDEAPPSYEESVGNQLQPPPLPARHQKSSSWNGTSIPSSAQCSQYTRDTANDVAEVINTAVKSLFSSFKPSTVERSYHKYSHIWSRPVPSRFGPKPLSRQFKVVPKDKISIKKGFHQNNYPSKELRSHDISEEDWTLFISGINSLIGVNSISGANDFDGLSISLKWVSWMNVTMDEKQMESNITALNEYINKWNNSFFNPRQIMVQLINDRDESTNSFKEQYLLIKSL